MRMPPRFTEPEATKSTLEPMAAIWSCTCRCAPWPTPTIAMTAATPMMMPSMVRLERILFRASARQAIFRMAMMSIAILGSILKRRHGLQHFRGAGGRGVELVAPHPSIAEDQHALGVLRNSVLVRDQHDGQPLLVEALEDVHDLHRGAAVEI